MKVIGEDMGACGVDKDLVRVREEEWTERIRVAAIVGMETRISKNKK